MNLISTVKEGVHPFVVVFSEGKTTVALGFKGIESAVSFVVGQTPGVDPTIAISAALGDGLEYGDKIFQIMDEDNYIDVFVEE